MRSFVQLLTCTLLVLVASIMTAQTKESLLIGPGDLLQVKVLDTPELDQAVRVTDSGRITLILGGNVQVSSQTPEQAALKIESALFDGHFLLHPHVAVSIVEFSTQKVSVLGEVKAPGAYSIHTARSVIDVLALAGGLTEVADRNVLIEDQATHQKTSYFISNAAEAAFDEAVVIHPGDSIYVPKAGLVYVLGDVGRPGGYTMTNNQTEITALQLVARAGGTNHSAVPSKARLMRKTADGFTETAIELSKMQKGEAPDMKLEADDIIYVPFSYMRNFGMQASGIAASVGSAAVYRF